MGASGLGCSGELCSSGMNQGLKLAATGTRRKNFVLEAAKSLPLPDDLLRQLKSLFSTFKVEGSQCIGIRAYQARTLATEYTVSVFTYRFFWSCSISTMNKKRKMEQ